MTTEAQAAANRARSLKIAAGRIGCTVDEYQAKRAAGFSWCSPHGEWHPVEAFSRGKKGLVFGTACREAKNAERRARMQGERAAKREREGVPPRQELKVELDEPRWPVWAPATVVGQLVMFADDKACVGHDVELWFPERDDGSLDEEKARRAKRICLFECPITDDCLTAALQRSELYGVFGGLTAAERNSIVTRGFAA